MTDQLEDLFECEPLLRNLYAMVPELMASGDQNPERRWVGIKHEFQRLVGWGSDKPELQNSEDYMLALRGFREEAERVCPEL